MLAAAGQLWNDVGRVRLETDRQRAALGRGCTDARQRVVERIRRLVEVARVESAPDAGWIDFDAQNGGAEECRGQRLRSPHAAQPGRQNRPTRQVRRVEMPLRGRPERLVGALEDPLVAAV